VGVDVGHVCCCPCQEPWVGILSRQLGNERLYRDGNEVDKEWKRRHEAAQHKTSWNKEIQGICQSGA
jgi:hypothetical protein